MSLRIGLYTIPHTGTRFASVFLRHHGIDFDQRHVSCKRKVPEWRHVLTVRDPYQCYLTHKRRFPTKLSDEYFVALWGHYIWRTQWQDAFYLPLDIDPQWRETCLKELVQFCGGTADFDYISEYAGNWRKVGHTGPTEEEEIPENLIEPLKFAYEWYQHYTEDWGAQFRHSRNVLGEGP